MCRLRTCRCVFLFLYGRNIEDNASSILSTLSGSGAASVNTEEGPPDKMMPLAGPRDSSAPIQIHQDANIYVTYLYRNEDIAFALDYSRQVYIVQIEGRSVFNGTLLHERDALQTVEESLYIKAEENSHILFIEMMKSE